MKLGTMRRVVGGKRYDTETASSLASDCYWDGHNWERSGRNTWLLRTPRGRYFTVTRTMWQGEQDTLEPCDLEEARELYEGPLAEHEVSYEAAFPTVQVEGA